MLVHPVDLKTEKVLLMNLTDEDNAFYIIALVHENGNGQLQFSRSIWFNRNNLPSRGSSFSTKPAISSPMPGTANGRHTTTCLFPNRS